MRLSDLLVALWRVTVSLVNSPPPPKPGASLAEIILSNTREYGPNPRTGGLIHRIDAAEAKVLEDIIKSEAPKYNLDPVLVIAGLCGESMFDPHAENPNYQDAKPNETPQQAFEHDDIGIAQLDGSLLEDEHEFPELKGMSFEQMKAKAFDPAWAIPKFCQHVRWMYDNMAKYVADDPSLLCDANDHDIDVLTLTAYNAGLTGARHRAHTGGNFNYGKNWKKRYVDYTAIIDGKAS